MYLNIGEGKATRTKDGVYLWCRTLSTRGHRVCRRNGCECECHNSYNPANYGDPQSTKAQREARLRKVKRIG